MLPRIGQVLKEQDEFGKLGSPASRCALIRKIPLPLKNIKKGETYFFPLHRHSDTDSRLTFVDAIKLLNQPDFKLLRWSPEDLEAYSEEARTISSSVSTGRYLFTELQKTYLEESFVLVPYL